MISPEELAIKAVNLKCFGEKPEGFERILPFNVIIGRNNSGKSTLLDMIDYVLRNEDITTLGHQGQTPEILFSWQLSSQIFKENLSDGTVNIQTDFISDTFNPLNWAMSELIGKKVDWSIVSPKQIVLRSIDYEPDGLYNIEKFRVVKTLLNKGVGRLPRLLSSMKFLRLAADRDLVREEPVDRNHALMLMANGGGATQVIERFMNSANPKFNQDLVEVDLLQALNEITGPDARFTRITLHEHDNKEWELVLEEIQKGRIPMSQTGSGLKTIILVLVNLILAPRMTGTNIPLSKYWFAFEELENNLHPAIQRRLFRFLQKTARKEKCRFFITTHSNVVIDLFANDDDAQILHLTHDGECASVRIVSSTSDGHGVLDDLGIRASDLLQTNAVIWVEGPSDRLYLRRWIDLWSREKLSEGIHYQILPVGGSVNSHFAFQCEETVNDLIKTLKISRHAIFLGDRDRTSASAELKEHTQRLKTEVEKSGGYGWITAGNEVENYIPKSALQRLCDNPKLRGPSKFTNAIAYFKKHKKRKTA